MTAAATGDGNERAMAATFVCPACEDEEHPDEVSVVKCDCGATIETYDEDAPAAVVRVSDT